jgi:hypothetical protein
VTWWALGAVVFAILEDWSYLDSLFFALTTISTIGFGNQVPTSTSSTIFAVIFAITGILLLAFMLHAFIIVVLNNLEQKIAFKIMELQHRREAKAVQTPRASGAPFHLALERESRVYQGEIPMDLSLDQPWPTNSVDPLDGQLFQTVAEARLEKKQVKSKEVMRQLVFALILIISYWMLGSLLFMFTEDWNYGRSIYFCFISLSTIGKSIKVW